jgi:AraC-like DNA-binding protein
VRVDTREAYFFLLNTGSDLTVTQHGREMTIAPGHVALISYSDTAEFRGSSENSWISATVPQRTLREFVTNADDLLAMPLDQGSEALKHFRRYVRILLGPDGMPDDTTLNEHVGKTLVELMAFSLGAGRDTAEVLGMRSVRAARAREVITEIKAGFADPAFSLKRAASKLRLSERYIQDLLAETGTVFTDRLMEARLQNARTMLENRLHDRLAIADIARGSGFGDVSYFNRCFRRRFGASPGDIRYGRR